MLEALNSTILKYEKDLSLQQAKREIETYDMVEGLVVIVRAAQVAALFAKVGKPQPVEV